MRIALPMVFIISIFLISAIASEQRHEDFSSKPAWDEKANRVDPSVVRAVTQDFGYNSGNHAIGGKISRSLTPATYSKITPTKTLEDHLTASGKFSVTNAKGNSGVLIGWFNSKSRGWRTPNSLAIRLDGNGSTYWVFFEYGTQNLRTGSGATFAGERYQTTKTKPEPADGTVHTWSLTYNPDGEGEIILILDGKSYKIPLQPGHKEDGAIFDRFGIFNQQTSGENMTVYFSDLVIDEEKQDLSGEPGWEGKGNRITFQDREIRPYHNFGYSPTNHAGSKSGEMGGLVWRIDKDYLDCAGYYADKIGKLTMDYELRAEGKVSMLRASADSAVLIGWFNSATHIGAPPHNFIGIMVEGPSRIGHYFRPVYSNSKGEHKIMKTGPIIQPDSKKHNWTLHYEPEANGKQGQITVTFNDESISFDLVPDVRKNAATFDRFGMLSYQRGGHYVDIYLDDISYTVQAK